MASSAWASGSAPWRGLPWRALKALRPRGSANSIPTSMLSLGLLSRPGTASNPGSAATMSPASRVRPTGLTAAASGV